MSDRVVVLGYGPVGKGVVAELVRRGTEVVVGQRTEPADLSGGARFTVTVHGGRVPGGIPSAFC